MRLGIKTDNVFLIELNEKNKQVQNLFLEKIKKITKKSLNRCNATRWHNKKTTDI